jgi:hypothetical protein
MKTSMMIAILFFNQPALFLKNSEWVKNVQGKEHIYTRPVNYSKSASPDSIAISEMFREVSFSIGTINKILKLNYTGSVKVFYFNYDEAAKVIGTNGGGFQSRKGIFYTYFQKGDHYDSVNRIKFYIGLHEFVHVVAWYKIGKSKSRLFVEGYANALDGYYGGRTIYEDVQVQEPIPPSRLIKDVVNQGGQLPEDTFYPQSGVFINWLFRKYGVEKVNRLYKVNPKKFEKKFEKITGGSFSGLEKEYLDYFAGLKK